MTIAKLQRQARGELVCALIGATMIGAPLAFPPRDHVSAVTGAAVIFVGVVCALGGIIRARRTLRHISRLMRANSPRPCGGDCCKGI